MKKSVKAGLVFSSIISPFVILNLLDLIGLKVDGLLVVAFIVIVPALIVLGIALTFLIRLLFKVDLQYFVGSIAAIIIFDFVIVIAILENNGVFYELMNA